MSGRGVLNEKLQIGPTFEQQRFVHHSLTLVATCTTRWNCRILASRTLHTTHNMVTVSPLYPVLSCVPQKPHHWFPRVFLVAPPLFFHTSGHRFPSCCGGLLSHTASVVMWLTCAPLTHFGCHLVGFFVGTTAQGICLKEKRGLGGNS